MWGMTLDIGIDYYSHDLGTIQAWLLTGLPFNAWCPQKSHTYLKKHVAESCRFV